MKELSDDELQRLFEDGHYSSKKPLNEDEKSYSTLFEALKHEPEGGLPYNFAANVSRHIQSKQKRGSELKSTLVAVAIFLGLIIVACGFLAVYGAVNTSTVLKYKWLLLLLPVVFIAIQYFDQKLVKTRIFRNSNNEI